MYRGFFGARPESTRPSTRRRATAVAGCALLGTAFAVALTAAPAAAAIPSAGNTGVPSGTALTVHTGDITITKAGTVVANLDLRGSLVVEAANVTIKNTIVRGGAAPTHNHCIINAASSKVSNLLVEDTELAPAHMNSYQNDICGSHYTLLRVNSHTGVDTADVFGSDVTIQDSWLHDTTYYAHDPNQGGHPSHNDTIQILGGSSIKVLNSVLDGGSNSAVQITQDHSSVSGVTISGNHVSGGTCSLRANDKPMSGMSGITLSNNVLTHSQSIKNCAVLMATGVHFAASGNVWSDGSAVKVIVYG